MKTKGTVLVLVSSGHGLPVQDGKVYSGAGYYLKDFALRAAGGDVSVVAPWKSYALQDREVISGQNPFSDEALLQLLLPALNGKKK
jgi:putative intracellular protease/amidase